MVGDHLRVYRRLKDRARILQLLSQLDGVDKVSVVGNRKRPLYIIDDQRLGVLHSRASRSRIADMSDSQIALQLGQSLLLENIIDMPEPFSRQDPAPAAGVSHGNAAALLPSVLQGKKPIIYGCRNIPPVQVISSEHSAFFTQACLGLLKITHVINSLSSQ